MKFWYIFVSQSMRQCKRSKVFFKSISMRWNRFISLASSPFSNGTKWSINFVDQNFSLFFFFLFKILPWWCSHNRLEDLLCGCRTLCHKCESSLMIALDLWASLWPRIPVWRTKPHSISLFVEMNRNLRTWEELDSIFHYSTRWHLSDFYSKSVVKIATVEENADLAFGINKFGAHSVLKLRNSALLEMTTTFGDNTFDFFVSMIQWLDRTNLIFHRFIEDLLLAYHVIIFRGRILSFVFRFQFEIIKLTLQLLQIMFWLCPAKSFRGSESSIWAKRNQFVITSISKLPTDLAAIDRWWHRFVWPLRWLAIPSNYFAWSCPWWCDDDFCTLHARLHRCYWAHNSKLALVCSPIYPVNWCFAVWIDAGPSFGSSTESWIASLVLMWPMMPNRCWTPLTNAFGRMMLKTFRLLEFDSQCCDSSACSWLLICDFYESIPRW